MKQQQGQQLLTCGAMYLNSKFATLTCQAQQAAPHLDSMSRAGSNSALPVALVGKDLHQANDDAVDVGVEALQAEGRQVAACLVACNGLVGPHGHQPLMHLQE